MKKITFLLTLLIVLPLVLTCQDTISIDTLFTPIESINDVIQGARDLTNAESVTFDMVYVYIVSAATFILGVLRNLVPSWKWLQNLNLTKIPREVTVALAGLSVVVFLIYTGTANVDWKILILAVFGTQGVYATLKSLIEKIPSEVVRAALLFVLGKSVKKPSTN